MVGSEVAGRVLLVHGDGDDAAAGTPEGAHQLPDAHPALERPSTLGPESIEALSGMQLEVSSQLKPADPPGLVLEAKSEA